MSSLAHPDVVDIVALMNRVLYALVLLCGCGGEIEVINARDAALRDATVVEAATNPLDSGDSAAPSDVEVLDSSDASPTCGIVGLPCCGSSCSTGTCCANTCDDLLSDPKNCGQCGHDCLGGACAAGICQPALLTKYATNGNPAFGGLIVDGAMLNWVAPNSFMLCGDTVKSCPITGCLSPTDIAFNLCSPSDISQDAANFYVADWDGKHIVTIDKKSKVQTNNLQAANAPWAIEVAGSAVFICNNGGVPYQLDSTLTNKVQFGGPAGWDIAPSTKYVYWGGDNSQITVATIGLANSSAVFANLPQGFTHVNEIESDSSTVVWQASMTYFGQTNIIQSCAVGATCSNPTTLATNQTTGTMPGRMAIDGANVYWTANDSLGDFVLQKCAVSGCSMKPSVAAHITMNQKGSWTGGIAIDASSIFFMMRDGGTAYLYRLAK